MQIVHIRHTLFDLRMRENKKERRKERKKERKKESRKKGMKEGAKESRTKQDFYIQFFPTVRD